MISSSFACFSILLNRSVLLHNGCTQRCGKRSIRITSDSFHSCTSELHWFFDFSLFSGSTVKMCTSFFMGCIFCFFFYSSGGTSKRRELIHPLVLVCWPFTGSPVILPGQASFLPSSSSLSSFYFCILLPSSSCRFLSLSLFVLP